MICKLVLLVLNMKDLHKMGHGMQVGCKELKRMNANSKLHEFWMKNIVKSQKYAYRLKTI